MSDQNDIVFQKFAAKVLLKVIERQDARAAAHEQLMLDLRNHNDAAARSAAAYQLAVSSPNQAVTMQAALSSMSLSGFIHSSAHTHSINTAISQNDITADEMEVIRAYHAGEDVLTVILSQER